MIGMDVEQHFREFQRIIDKYSLSEEQKAREIAEFLTKNKEGMEEKKEIVSADEFATYFAMSKEEAVIFLSFIEKGIRFRESSTTSTLS